MRKLVLATFGVLLGLGLLVAVLAHSNSAEAATGPCRVETVGTKNGAGQPNSKFTIENNTAFIKFNVLGGDNCKQTVALKSWLSPSANGTPHGEQQLYKEVTRTFSPGAHRMSVDLPAKGCFYQVDFVKVLSDSERAANDGKNEMLGYVLDGNKNCVVPPKYSCDLFGITGLADRKVTVNAFKTSATGATYKRAVIMWGDGANSGTRTTTNTVGTTHQYAKDGTYTIYVTAFFTLNNASGKEVSATSAACTKKVTFNGTKPPVVVVTTPPTTKVETPQKLVDTGAGSVFAIFGAVSTFGAAAHTFIMRRRILG